MAKSEVTLVRPSAVKQVVPAILMFVGLAGAVVGISIAVLGTRWLFSPLGVAVFVVDFLVSVTFAITSIVLKKPQIELGPDGFVFRSLFATRSRKWSDISGEFTQLKIGMGKHVAYRLKDDIRTALKIKPQAAFGGNDEVINGYFDLSTEQLVALLNEYRS